MDRIEMDGDYLIIAPKKEGRFHYELTERTYLVDNILNFLELHPDVRPHQIVVYELQEVNQKTGKKSRS